METGKKDILISIRPEWCDQILNGYKTLELRKSRPKQEPPYRCYIYESGMYIPSYMQDRYAGRYQPGSVVGYFTCDYILRHCESENIETAEAQSRVSREGILRYAKHGEVYGLHIIDLTKFPKPITLREVGLRRAPQSWCYVERVEGL